MKEARLLRRLQNGESAALGEIMEFYTPYVAAIVRNIIDPPKMASSAPGSPP